MTDRNKKKTYIALAFIAVLGLAFHLYRISWPAKPAFDEAHFATYAADYVERIPFFDIHPPLGKLIYAAAISATGPRNLGNAQFVTIKKSSGIQDLLVINNNLSFGSYPYVALRVVSAVFGVALALAFYWFLRNIGVSNIGSLLGALFVVLENAMLVETRLILLDGMFLAFGFAALAMYFKKPRWSIASGVVWGLSLAVKLTGIVFAAPLIAGFFMKKKDGAEAQAAEKSHILKFFAAAAVVFVLLASGNTLFFSVKDRLAVFQSLGFIYPKNPPPQSLLLASAVETMFSVGNYIAGNAHPAESAWYFWPAMQIPMTYYYETVGATAKQILLDGNPIVWFGGTLAVIFALAFLPRYLKNFLRAKATGGEDYFGFLLLLGGYAGSLLPFLTLVRRSTFLYHYFPALIFAIGLLAWFLSRALKLEDFDKLSRTQLFWLAIIVIVAVAGFLRVAPVTYGL